MSEGIPKTPNLHPHGRVGARVEVRLPKCLTPISVSRTGPSASLMECSTRNRSRPSRESFAEKKLTPGNALQLLPQPTHVGG